MALKVALVGSADRQLDDMLRTAGMKVAALETSGLASLAAPGSQQPDA